MKLYVKAALLLLALLMVFTGCDTKSDPPKQTDTEQLQTGTVDLSHEGPHIDDDSNTYCDLCGNTVIVYIDLYAINDLHGKFDDTASNEGVDELTTYFKNAKKTDDHVILLSSGDMWQGSSESNLTQGLIITDWMNELDFAAMTLGNHEYDWGEELITLNNDAANFPFIAINIFDRSTDERVEYCQASVVIEKDGLQIGIIGAMGDCYSSISGDKSGDVYFKVDDELTELVKAESERLRNEGVDFIVYSIHDGYGKSLNGSVGDSSIASYYDIELSEGYIDLVFEGHTHQSYVLIDSQGVYHLQNGGDNRGISHAEIAINSVTLSTAVNYAEFVPSSRYTSLDDDPIVDFLLEKYKDTISKSNEILGNNDRLRNSEEIKQLVAKLYYELGESVWGEEYDIVLGGGFISVRSPYKLNVGDVKYGDVQSILPFDNQIVLCSISGRDLKNKFFETSNDNYYIAYGEYGKSVKNNIDLNKTYYVIADTYSSSYAPNRLTVVASYEDGVYARDLLAQYIKDGGFTSQTDNN